VCWGLGAVELRDTIRSVRAILIIQFRSSPRDIIPLDLHASRASPPIQSARTTRHLESL
jgi:hypothetical protein